MGNNAETWRQCPSYPNYEASNMGRVRSFARNWRRDGKGRVLNPHPDRGGYKRLHITVHNKDKMIRVHRMVADAFLKRVGSKPYVNHIDGDKGNNIPGNLEWCSFKENMRHAHTTGLFSAVVGENNHLSRLTEADVLDIRNTHNLGCVTQQELADAWNVARTTIRAVVNYKTWKHI